MMRWDSFGRSLGFAALAAVGSVGWLLVSGPVLGGRRALALYLVGTTALYLGGLGRSPHRRLLATLVAGLTGGLLCIVAPGLSELVLGLAAVLAVGRSVFLHRGTPARAVATEAALALLGLGFAWGMAAPALRSIMLAIWSYFLVQSLFFLLGDVRATTARAPAGDPFDAAHGRALALLEEVGR